MSEFSFSMMLLFIVIGLLVIWVFVTRLQEAVQ